MHEQALQQLKQRHDFQRWRGRNTLPEGLFILGLVPRAIQLPGFRLERSQRVPAGGDEVHYQSVWTGESGAPGVLVRLDLHSCLSRAAAHELIARLLGGFQSPALARDDTLPIGDVCFSGPGHGAIVFARANLAIFIARIGTVPLSMVELARSIDRVLTEKPVSPAPPAAASGARARRAAVTKVKVGSKKALPASAGADVPEAEGAFAKIFSSGGEVSIERGRLVFAAERPGPAHVDAFVVERAQTMAGRRTLLDVE
jgi:hypothetical protein